MEKPEPGGFFAPQWELTPYMVSLLPELPGVFALWEGKELVYIGRATPPTTLRALLEQHVRGQHACTARASHYAWQLALDPAKKERELLAQYRALYRQFPRCNRAEL